MEFEVSTPNPHLTALNPHLDTNAYPVMFTNVTWSRNMFSCDKQGIASRLEAIAIRLEVIASRFLLLLGWSPRPSPNL